MFLKITRYFPGPIVMYRVTLSHYGIFFVLQIDARVQVVTEVMNAIRMIKVFSWEKRIDEKIADKREEELVYQRKRIILEITSNILKCVQLSWLWVMALTILQVSLFRLSP